MTSAVPVAAGERTTPAAGSRWLLACTSLFAIANLACASPADGPPASAVVDAQFGDERLRIPLDALVERATLAPDQDFSVTLIGADDHQSHHLVAIRTAETPHRHDEHDLLVVVIEGRGSMLVERQRQPVGAGSVVYIPRRTRHAFRNESGAPATAYVIYTPPFDGKDRVADE